MKKIALSLAIVFFCAGLLSARDVAGVTVPDSIQAGGSDLVLNGAGLRTKFFFKVYVGSLYLKKRTSDASAVIAADEPMAIRLDFLMDVEAAKIIDAWTEGFENSAGSSYDALKDKISRFNGCFREDSKKGTRYDIVYVPGDGVAVSVNGSEKARIPGADFKKAVFGIWLGEKPADRDLKKGMLKD